MLWAMRCQQHGLAVGPEGECVLCLRDHRARTQRRARFAAVGVAGLLLSTCGALLLLRAPRTAANAEPPPVLAVASAPAPPRPTDPSLEATVTYPSPAPLPPENMANMPQPEPFATASAISLAPVLVPSAVLAPGAPVRSERELMAALRATPVSMFSASWCRHCQRARSFFRANGLNVVDHDIDLDARAAAELKRRSGGTAVPLIDVDGRVLRGFDERATLDAIVASVERRMGVTGIQLSVASASR